MVLRVADAYQRSRWRSEEDQDRHRRTEMILAAVNLSDARRNLNAFNQVLRGRRADLYAEMLGAHRPARLVLAPDYTTEVS